MKKLTVWALLATLVVAGSAFARTNQVVANATFLTGSPATTNNDDSCDIGVAPAATLLLPYFEVDLASRTGENTIFTITNVSAVEQIAHITLWTDYSFPVIDFNVFLTGYDVQSISLYDVIALGLIAPSQGTGFEDPGSHLGAFSSDEANPLVDETTCEALPMDVGDLYRARMQNAFVNGTLPAFGSDVACTNIGSSGHPGNAAIGYATVDVASVCGTQLPSDPGYFTAGGEALFDNVLIGDYQQINSGQNFAQGNPMVHIRAIPEGGVPGSGLATNFDRTFYGRYQPAANPRADRRQPLPSTFAARWIQGGSGDFQTFYKIWREGRTAPPAAACTGAGAVTNNRTGVTEFVTFDEIENAVGGGQQGGPLSPPLVNTLVLPETGRYSVAGGVFPRLTNGALAGWTYMNLDNNVNDAFASQNWVVVSMRAEGRYSVDFDAAWLGNGCTPQTAQSEISRAGGITIGPAANVTPDVFP